MVWCIKLDLSYGQDIVYGSGKNVKLTWGWRKLHKKQFHEFWDDITNQNQIRRACGMQSGEEIYKHSLGGKTRREGTTWKTWVYMRGKHYN